jgi:hypothetical protein
MGAWDAGPFDNDDAAGLLAEFDEAPSLAIIEAPLGMITNAAPGDYIEAPECSQAVAAAALMALAPAPASNVVSQAALGFLTQLAAPERVRLASMAIAALTRISSDSELKELWDESDDETARDDWYSSLATLHEALSVR